MMLIFPPRRKTLPYASLNPPSPGQAASGGTARRAHRGHVGGGAILRPDDVDSDTSHWRRVRLLLPLRPPHRLD